jgi:hypothetical protein
MPNPSQGPVVDVSRAAANAIGNQNVTSKYQPSPRLVQSLQLISR